MTIDENDKAQQGKRPKASEGAVRVGARPKPKAPPPSSSAPPPTPPFDGEVPEIKIRADEHRVNDEAVAALAAGDPDVYARGPHLVHIAGIPPETKKREGVWHPEGALTIHEMASPTLRERLARCARWTEQPAPKLVKGVEEWPDERITHPPPWCVEAVINRRQWPGVRELRGIVEVPTLRPSGTVIEQPGYDAETGFYYRPRLAFPPIPKEPTQDDAARCADDILELVREYRFASDGYRAPWLASALTPFARPAIDGAIPFFLVEANTRGAGKTMLCDLVGVLATGREMPRTARPSTEDEWRKLISSIALGGDQIVLVDNVKNKLDSAAFEAALTGKSWKDRALGGLTMTPETPLLAIWYGTGNNADLSPDLARRSLHVRIEVATDRPELLTFERPGKALLDFVRRDRPRLVVAALTILRAYAVAGRPIKLDQIGSFDSWRETVAGAVEWAGVGDPLAMREALLETADSDRATISALLTGWAEMDTKREGMHVRQVLADLQGYPERYHTLRDAVCEFAGAKGGELPPAVSLGKRLRRLRGVVANGHRFTEVGQKGELGKRWASIPIGGTSGAAPSSPAEG